MNKRDGEAAREVESQRATKEDARRQGLGAPAAGTEPPARSYVDDTGVADLGVDEPIVPASPPDSGQDGRRPGPDPTGMFAGETEADRHEETRVRQVLEDGYPETRGRWKHEGQLPPPDSSTRGRRSRDRP